eukprot:m.16827 g.16827  ORF g.16827 m.16827 type:complete len:627 (-) comp7729_c1_seq1:119-1999(-)
MEVGQEEEEGMFGDHNGGLRENPTNGRRSPFPREDECNISGGKALRGESPARPGPVPMDHYDDARDSALDGEPQAKRRIQEDSAQDKPMNPMVGAMLTDYYQITMAFAYWRSGKHNDPAVFDLFFRKNPFQGEFTIFAGLEECLHFLKHFRFTQDDIKFLRDKFPPTTEQAFFDYLLGLSCAGVQIYAVDEGSVVFPRTPLLRVEGPLAVVQMLETTLLTLVNYASLVATNAARYRLAAGPDKLIMEFGLRRAQGPDGGMSASRYCFMGGCNATSNVLAGKKFNIPVSGTHAHAFVSSFSDESEVAGRSLLHKDYPDGTKKCPDFWALVMKYYEKMQELLGARMSSIRGELVAFTAYALAFPNDYLALIDTYDLLRSGAPNFCCVALALGDLGYEARGVRLDSGDLAYQSIECRNIFKRVAQNFERPKMEKMVIVASNDINEQTLHSLQAQGHAIDAFGIGTNLVTCEKQPALGCVYKIVQVKGVPCMKISADLAKVTIPGRKVCYRLFGKEGQPICDLMQTVDEPAPVAGDRVLCRHPFEESKRVMVVISKVEVLHKLYFSDGKITQRLPSLTELRSMVMTRLAAMRKDHLRHLNPTPYKVSVTPRLYDFMHKLWLDRAPVVEVA